MRRSTIIYVLLFAVIFFAAYYFNKRARTADISTGTETVEPAEYVFSAADGLPTHIHIESKAGQVIEVERNAENAWVVKLPSEAAADQGSVEAAASQVSTIRVTLHLTSLAPDAVGLDTPEYIMTLKFTSGVERILKIGVITPTESGYYARTESGDILIVSKSAVDSLLGLLANPPYLATEIPAAATETATPASP